MSDTRNHTDLAAAIHTAIWDLSRTEQWPILGDDFPAAEALARALEPYIAAVRAAAVAETTAAIEALATYWESENAWGIGEQLSSALRAALSGGRTALDTTLAQAWDEGWEAAWSPMSMHNRDDGPNPYRADTGADQ